MRIAIRHEINYRYKTPAQWMLRVLRVTPWAIDNQHLDRWRVDLDCDCRVKQGDDAFGNVVHSLSAASPVDSLSVVAQGIVETTDNAGVLRNQLERFPPEFYLRDSDATATDESLREFSIEAVKGATSPLDRLHALLSAIADAIEFAPSAEPAKTAVETFISEKGTARDLAHVFIAAARHSGAPARYVSGCYVDPDSGAPAPDRDASHSWAEAFVPELGWIGFDPALGLCTHDGHVRIAIALDHLGAMPIRGAQTGGGDEKVTSRLCAHDASREVQRQERSFGMTQDQFQT